VTTRAIIEDVVLQKEEEGTLMTDAAGETVPAQTEMTTKALVAIHVGEVAGERKMK